MSDYIPDPFRNFTPRQNPAQPVIAQKEPEAPDLSGMTDDELRQECRESLVLMMRRAKGDLKALGAVKELLDRIEGRPIQRQAVDMRVEAHNTITHEMRIAQADEEADRIMRLVAERLK